MAFSFLIRRRVKTFQKILSRQLEKVRVFNVTSFTDSRSTFFLLQQFMKQTSLQILQRCASLRPCQEHQAPVFHCVLITAKDVIQPIKFK